MQQMNAIAPGGIASMMRGMPQGQPQKPLSPTAGIGNVADRMKAYGPQMLEQKNAVSEDLLNLIAAQKLKSEKEAALRDMQMKAAQQGQPLTVAQSLDKELMQMTKQELAPQQAAPQVAGASQQQEQQKQAAMQKLMQGIARAPGAQQMPGMAAGGIVAFQNRGEVPDPLDAARQRRRVAQENLYKFGSRQRQENPEAFSAAQEELRAAERDLSRIEMQISGGPAGVMRQSLRGPDIQGAYEDTASRAKDVLQQAEPSISAPEIQTPSQEEPPKPGTAPVGGPGILGNLKKPVISPQAGGVAPGLGSQAQGPTPLQGMARPPERPPEQAGPQIPDLEAARRMGEDRARGIYGLSDEERRIYDEREARLKQPPKEQRWYERLGALAPYLAQQRIDPGRGGIAGGLGRIGLAGAQLGAAEKTEEDKRRSALEALQNQRLQAMRTGREKIYEAGRTAEETAAQRGFKKEELDIGRGGLDVQRDRTRSAAETAEYDRRSRERMSLAEIASRERIEAAKLEQLAEQTGQVRLANSLAAANGKVQSALKAVEDAVKKRFGAIGQLVTMDPEKAKKSNPEQYSQYVSYVSDLKRTILEPAILERDRLQDKILGSSTSYKPPAPTAPRGQVDPNNPLLK